MNNINYDFVINKDLRVMDTASISLAKENKIPIIVFSILQKDSLVEIINGGTTYTMINE